MSEIITRKLSDAVTLHSFTDPGFKTMRLAVNLLVPMSWERAAHYALLPTLVTRATRAYPDYTALSARLAELYGASLGAGVQKIGAYQVLSLSVGGISSRYALDGEDLLGELSGLLFSVLFDPLRDGDGLFPQEGFDQEKRQQLEQKDADFSDKMIYAHQRCHEILFEGSPAGLDRLGSREAIGAMTREEVTAAWDELLRAARFEIFALGDCQPEPEIFRERFAGLGRSRGLSGVEYPMPDTCRRVTEEQAVTQSKLVMAFRAQVSPEERLLFQLMSAVLGEPTSSKLFQNVREKQGLCYYCDSAFSWANGALFIESGVEADELERAEHAIMEQVTAIQGGAITEDELQCAKLYLCNSLRSVKDSLHRVEGWYLGRTFDEEGLSPERALDRLMGYTVDDVVQAASRLRPAVIYTLKGRDG